MNRLWWYARLSTKKFASNEPYKDFEIYENTNEIFSLETLFASADDRKFHDFLLFNSVTQTKR